MQTISNSIFMFFLPGFLLSLVIFKKEKLTFLERVVFSFVFSITILPLMVFYSNLLGVPVTLTTVSMQILFLSINSITIFIFQQRKEVL